MNCHKGNKHYKLHNIFAYNAQMDITTLKTFVQVMHEMSFSEVAKSHRVAPSSISRAIAKLEADLGVSLFHRNTRNLTATEAGNLYLQRIQPVLEELEAAGQLVSDVQQNPSGILRVTAATIYGQRYIVPLLKQFRRLYPELSIELILTDNFVDLVADRIDLAIRLGSLQESTYVARRLAPMAFYICASPDYLQQHGAPQQPSDLSQHECLLFPRQGENLNWTFRAGNGEQQEITIQGSCLITSSEAIRQCAVSGMGLALLPDWLVTEDIEAGRLTRLFETMEVTATDFNSAIWLVRPSGNYLPLKTRVFIDYLVAQTESSSDNGRPKARQ